MWFEFVYFLLCLSRAFNIFEFSMINNNDENKQLNFSIAPFLFISIAFNNFFFPICIYSFATPVVISIEMLSGVTVYRSTRELHPPSTNSDATFDNFNPSPFRVLVGRERNPWIKTAGTTQPPPFPFLEHEGIPRQTKLRDGPCWTKPQAVGQLYGTLII